MANQGDGWGYTLAYLERALVSAMGHGAEPKRVHGAYLTLMHTLATRTG